VLLLTGWPVTAVFVGVGGYLLPTQAAAKRRRKEAVDRVEAIAVWAENLRDTMAASAGMQEALRTSARVAPAPISVEVNDLAVRLQHESVISALRRFAADMHHPLSDMVVASLIMASSRHGGSLQGVLAMAAKSARDWASMWRHIEGGRAQVYAQSRMAGWVSFIVTSFFVLVRRDFLRPFDSFFGQMVMFVVCSAFFASGVAIYRLGQPLEPRRMFKGIEGWAETLALETGGDLR
jgi:tight adherence protein B